jgi:hypothetical protein
MRTRLRGYYALRLLSPKTRGLRDDRRNHGLLFDDSVVTVASWPVCAPRLMAQSRNPTSAMGGNFVGRVTRQRRVFCGTTQVAKYGRAGWICRAGCSAPGHTITDSAAQRSLIGYAARCAMPAEPKIPKAPSPCPPGWGWRLMAGNAERMYCDDYAAHCSAMAEASERAGRHLLDGESAPSAEWWTCRYRSGSSCGTR